MPDTLTSVPKWREIESADNWRNLRPEQQDTVRRKWLEDTYRTGKAKGIELTGEHIRVAAQKIGYVMPATGIGAVADKITPSASKSVPTPELSAPWAVPGLNAPVPAKPATVTASPADAVIGMPSGEPKTEVPVDPTAALELTTRNTAEQAIREKAKGNLGYGVLETILGTTARSAINSATGGVAGLQGAAASEAAGMAQEHPYITPVADAVGMVLGLSTAPASALMKLLPGHKVVAALGKYVPSAIAAQVQNVPLQTLAKGFAGAAIDLPVFGTGMRAFHGQPTTVESLLEDERAAIIWGLGIPALKAAPFGKVMAYYRSAKAEGKLPEPTPVEPVPQKTAYTGPPLEEPPKIEIPVPPQGEPPNAQTLRSDTRLPEEAGRTGLQETRGNDLLRKPETVRTEDVPEAPAEVKPAAGVVAGRKTTIPTSFMRNPNNVSSEFGVAVRTSPRDELQFNRLKKSIAQEGIKEPIELYIEKDGTATIIEGTHRLWAAEQLGIKDVPYIINGYANGEARSKFFSKLAKESPPPPSPAVQEVQAKTVEKQPWEMTKDEYLTFKKTGKYDLEYYASLHGTSVKQAISAGKPVPASVLADYPDLAKPTRASQAAAIRKTLKAEGKRTKARSLPNEYLNEQINYGGEIRSRGSVIAELQKAKTPQANIDAYMMGAKTVPEAPAPPPNAADAPTEAPGGMTDTLNRMEVEAKARINKRMTRLSASDPVSLTIRSVQDLSDFAIVGAAKLNRGVREFAQWSKEMLDEFGKGIEPHLKAIYAMAENEYDQHRFTKRVSADESVADEVRSAVAERMYPIKHNIETVAEVKKLVQKNGIDESERIFMRGDETAKDEVRIGLGIGLMKYFGDAAKKAATPEAKDAMHNRMADIAEKMDDIGLKSGRAIQMFTNWNSWEYIFANPEAAQVIAKRAARKAGVTLTPQQFGEIKALADKVAEAPEGFQRRDKTAALEAYVYQAVTPKMRNMQDLSWALWYANIFSGYKSHERNILGNVSNVFTDVSALVVTNPRHAVSAFLAAAKGFGAGATEAYAHLTTGRSIIKGDIKYEAGRINPLEINRFRGIAYPLNAWKYVGRFLTAEDVLFFKPAQEAKKLMMAHEIAAREGLTGKDAMKRIIELEARTPEDIAKFKKQAQAEGLKGLDFIRRVAELQEQFASLEITAKANEFAGRATFNYDPEGHLGLMAKHVAQMTNDVPPLKFIVPVTRIVANVANAGLDLTPWGFYRTARGRMKTGKGKYREMASDERQMRFAKATMGTLAVSAAVALSLENEDKKKPLFRLTGKGPVNINQRNQLYETGWRPYSVHVGNEYISYLQTPMAIPFAVAGNLLDARRYGKFDEADNLSRFFYAMNSGATVITQMSFLSGIAGLFSALDTGSPQTAAESLKRMVSRTGQSVVIPNFIKQLDDLYDPTLRDNANWKTFVSEIPVAQAYLKPRLNVLGEPIKVNQAVVLSPVRHHPIFDLLAKNDAVISPPSKSTEINGSPILDEDVFYDFAKIRGETLKRTITNNLYSSEYKTGLTNMSPEQFRKELAQLSAYATGEGKSKVIEKYGLKKAPK